MHPFCRSTTIADFGAEQLQGLERQAKDKDGNTVKVPGDMTFEEWEKGLDKSAESGIMEVRSGNVAEREREYGVPYGAYAVNADLEYINSDKYTKKFDNITDNADVNKAILE